MNKELDAAIERLSKLDTFEPNGAKVGCNCVDCQRRRENESLRAEVARLTIQVERMALLQANAQAVVDTFSKDEAQGYRSRDRQFALSLLQPILLTLTSTKSPA